MTEPQEPTAPATDVPVDAPAAGPDGDTAAPAKAAAKKAAPRKRAPRKRAPAKKAAAAVEVEPTDPADVAPVDAPLVSSNDGAPPVTPVEQPVEPAAPEPAGEVTPGEAGAAAEQAEPAAAPEPTAADPVSDVDEDEDDDAPRAAVLFQPPTTPRRRRRAASAPAGPPVHQEPPVEVPVTAPAAVAFGAPVLDEAPVADDPTLDAPAVGDDAEPTKPARRGRSRRAATTARTADPAVDEATDGTYAADTPESVAPTEPAEPTESAEPTDTDPESDTDGDDESGGRRRRRGRRGRGRRTGTGEDETGTDETAETGGGADDGPATGSDDAAATDAEGTDEDSDDTEDADADAEGDGGSGTSRRRRRRRRRGGSGGADDPGDDDTDATTVVHVREPREAKDGGRDGGGRRRRGDRSTDADDDGVRGVRGSTRLEAKRQRRRDGRDNGRKRAPILSEAEFLARREAVERVMAIRQHGDRTQIGVLEDDVLVEHYVTRASATSYVGNVYLGRVQNVLPSMEAAFVDIGKGRNGVLYAGEVNWDAAGLDGKSRSIEHALHSGDTVLVQVTKDPVGHKGARLTSQVSLPGRYLVYVPGGGMTGISRKLPDTERSRLKAILKKVVPEDGGVIVRTAAEGASEQDLARDVERLVTQWESIQARTAKKSSAPELVHGEPDLAIRVVRDVFNEDVTKLVVQGESAYAEVSGYLADMAPELADRVSRYTGTGDVFHDLRIDEQLAKALDRKVWLPSGGSLVIDRTEAMTVVDVNTGKYIGSGGNLEETVTRNNLEAAEEIVRQLRLRDVGGIIVVDFIDMVLESNRDLVLRRLTECLGRDRTKHQVAEVTSLGLVQMTRKRVGEGLLEAFSTTCEHCHGRGVMISSEPVDQKSGNGNGGGDDDGGEKTSGRRRRGRSGGGSTEKDVEPSAPLSPVDEEKRRAAAEAMAAMARTAAGETGPVADLAGVVGEDALADTVEEAVAEVVAPGGAGTPAVEVDAGQADPVEVDAAEPIAADVDDAPEPAAAAAADAAPVETAPVETAPVETAPVTDTAPVADTEPTGTAGETAAPPAKKAAPRRRRAARRPAGAPAAEPGAGSEAPPAEGA